MKKSILIACLLCTVYGAAQTYAFDFVTKYALNAKNDKRQESVVYFNSDDFSYNLRLQKSPGHFRAILTDEDEKTAHRFDVAESRIKGEIVFSFTYTDSFKLNGTVKIYSRNEFSEIPGNPKQVLMKVYHLKRAKKPSHEHLLTLQPANKNLFAMYSISRSHAPFSLMNKSVDYPGNYIVVRDEITESKVKCELVLEEHRNVDLVLNLPEKLNF